MDSSIREAPARKIHETTRPARYVRFTADELEKIQEDERKSKKSAQELLKRAYFENGRVMVLMTDEDKHWFMAQISRIGNNVNQIARKINSGFAFGFAQEMAEVRTLLTQVQHWITAKYAPNKVT